ncbi:MAG: hypothetical protein JSU63_17505 [Phycisphaerales bacterium]|nr:MAG: hypothetical protein JSU63_17505 [Phycisphaerales bacterium]
MALVMLGFAIVSVALVESGFHTTDDKSGSIMLVLLGVLVVLETLAYFLIRRSMIGELRQTLQEDTGEMDRTAKLAGGFNSLTLLGAPMPEGVGLYSVLVYLMSGSVVGLAAAGVALLLVLMHWPTENKARSFVESVTGQRI